MAHHHACLGARQLALLTGGQRTSAAAPPLSPPLQGETASLEARLVEREREIEQLKFTLEGSANPRTSEAPQVRYYISITSDVWLAPPRGTRGS